jgi:hypothetical protein
MRSLPRLELIRWKRIAPQIRSECLSRWGLNVIVIDILPGNLKGDGLILAKASLRRGGREARLALTWLPIEDIPAEDLSPPEFELLLNLSSHGASGRGRFSSLHWMDAAFEWIRVEIPALRKNDFSSIEQLTASASSALFSLTSSAGTRYWFKAGSASEYRLTAMLGDRSQSFLPEIVALKEDWNAWLTRDSGTALDERDLHPPRFFVSAARRFAELQRSSLGFMDDLRTVVSFDQSVLGIRQSFERVLPILCEAMHTHDLSRPAPFDAKCIHGLSIQLTDLLIHLEHLSIPDTLTHDDLHLGNILFQNEGCTFIDWAEGSVGIPFLALEQLRLHAVSVPNIWREAINAYCAAWSGCLTPSQIGEALEIATPLSIAARLTKDVAMLSEGIAEKAKLHRRIRILTRQLDRAISLYKSRHLRSA